MYNGASPENYWFVGGDNYLRGFISAAFTITRPEYVRAIRRYYKTKLHVKRDLVGGVIAIAGGVFLLNTIENVTVAWLLIVSGVVLASLVLYAIFALPAMIYRSQPKLKDEYRLEFREEGIGFKTKNIDSNLEWSIYHSWLRDNEFYILYHGTRDVTVVPRRSFASGDEDRLKDLLVRKIGLSL
ncbi:MAG: YcxB family protein [Planctomycetota bacterium]|nr:YcxB family protein [Planctomycetota bacterium]